MIVKEDKLCPKCNSNNEFYHRKEIYKGRIYYYKSDKLCVKCLSKKNRINKEHNNLIKKERRHRLGISKKYREECLGGVSSTKEYKKLSNQSYRHRLRGGGKLSISCVQRVYEDNIKKYGTLTCYLCELPIEFGKDHLEHKMPLSRGGTNQYENLEIACQKCNCKKRDKTVEEFLIFKNGDF